MNTSDATTATNSTQSAEIVGKRLLTLIDRLNARSDISLGHFAEAMGVPVGEMEPRHNGYSTSVPIDEDWLYSLDLSQETSSSPWHSIVFQLDHTNLHEYADFAPVCGMTFDDYRQTFKIRGFPEKFDSDGAGRLLAANYTADNFFIIVKPGMKSSGDNKAYPSCVRRIELMNRKRGG